MSHGPPDLPIHLVPPLGGLLSTRGGHGKGLQPCFTIREDLTDRARPPPPTTTCWGGVARPPPTSNYMLGVAELVSLEGRPPPRARAERPSQSKRAAALKAHCCHAHAQHESAVHRRWHPLSERVRDAAQGRPALRPRGIKIPHPIP